MAIDYLRRYLNVRWLRPENVMWRTVSSRAMSDFEYEEPSLDLGCGDGITSFIRAGGDFETSFDIFTGVGNLDEFFEDEDIYDAAPDTYDPDISQRPNYSISVGLDHKQALLDKAAKLDFYDELLQHDNNEPLPFDDGEFRTIFSNAVYWVENVDLHLEEISRVLDDSGEALLVLRTPHVHQFLDYLHAREDVLGEEFVDMIDRGRSEHYPSLHTEEGWDRKLEAAGLEISEKRSVISTTHAGIWDVGLRPISPLTIKMANALGNSQRRKIKSEWIDLWEELLEPLCEPMFELERDDPAAEILYFVTPQ
ncbi:class I SAM-dependent methyltransferase [Halorientalis halophila]|uniref:class I SAM-dependent methyltransferase n=1 Tax=Halorientalis halophila TaxID=3108499 RepID=UPI00300B8FB7